MFVLILILLSGSIRSTVVVYWTAGQEVQQSILHLEHNSNQYSSHWPRLSLFSLALRCRILASNTIHFMLFKPCSFLQELERVKEELEKEKIKMEQYAAGIHEQYQNAKRYQDSSFYLSNDRSSGFIDRIYGMIIRGLEWILQQKNDKLKWLEIFLYYSTLKYSSHTKICSRGLWGQKFLKLKKHNTHLQFGQIFRCSVTNLPYIWHFSFLW